MEAVSQMAYSEKIRCFSSIKVREPSIEKRRVSGNIILTGKDGKKEEFRLIFTYNRDVNVDSNIAGLMLAMPVINFTYFAGELELDFPVSEADSELIEEFLRINAREVFINKICRRRYEFFRKEYLPSEEDINSKNADGETRLIFHNRREDTPTSAAPPNGSLVLSSGGKESLLTYAILNEMDNGPAAFFFNESGGHWRTAKTSYDYFSKHFSGVTRVWSNVDRFYRFMLSRLNLLDNAVVKKRADTYPVQLFIFPVYVFSAIPFLSEEGIGNILMGNEFDDPRDMPEYRGMKHYYGIYDQSSDFMQAMTSYFQKKGIAARLWSAVYPISGIMVEEILVKRYREFFLQQRSCHSCRLDGGQIKPCGECTKCLGVMMFIKAAGGDPSDILYSQTAIGNLEDNVLKSRMRIDPDEMRYLSSTLWGTTHEDNGCEHVRGIHLLPAESEFLAGVPENFRKAMSSIYEEYCSGYYTTDGKNWNAAFQK